MTTVAITCKNCGATNPCWLKCPCKWEDVTVYISGEEGVGMSASTLKLGELL
jgi:hypothetical protein